jgi:hypothetical protein
MTKIEKQIFEDLVRQISSKWCPFDNYDVEEEWQEFYRKVFRINSASEVLMKYEGTLFDLPQYTCLM